MEINLNIQRYWLPGRRLNTGYIAVVVHTRMTTAVTNPALDFLYPRKPVSLDVKIYFHSIMLYIVQLS